MEFLRRSELDTLEQNLLMLSGQRSPNRWTGQESDSEGAEAICSLGYWS